MATQNDRILDFIDTFLIVLAIKFQNSHNLIGLLFDGQEISPTIERFTVDIDLLFPLKIVNGF